MSRNKRKYSSDPISLNLSSVAAELSGSVPLAAAGGAVDAKATSANASIFMRMKSRLWMSAAIGLLLLLGLGVMAANGWLSSTDAMTGKKTGWFRSEPGAVATGFSLFSPPPPSTSLSKEYIYAGSRLLAVEDANANAAPPADLAVWRPSSGIWYVLGGEGSQQTSYQYGADGDKPIAGDFDGDGKTDFSVYRPSTGFWHVTRSSDGSEYSVYFGLSTDTPAAADYDGDGKTDLAVYRPSTNYWYIVYSSTGQTHYFQYGSSGDIPAPADYDGDGRADLAVWRPSTTTFHSMNSSNGQFASATIGYAGTPVSADYDGDGKADYAVFTSTNANWHIRKSTNPSTVTTTQWGTSTGGDTPVQNDYDGDAKVDLATWRSDGRWWIQKSATAQTREEYWGTSGDIPVPAYYRR